MARFSSWRWYVVLGLLGLVLTLAQVWIRLQVVAVGYKLSNTQQLIRSLKGDRQALRMEWSALTTPQRLAEQAAKRLRMRVAQPEQIVRLP
ncbi:MAG: hypothetical protein AB7G75_28605 [Candidatus Binatia bacterium]